MFPGTYLKNFISLIYPDLCCVCQKQLFGGELHICSHCLAALPHTGFHTHPENPLAEIFRGRIPIEGGTALLHFQKGGMVQRLIHQFKYRKDLALGFWLGQRLGSTLKHSPIFAGIDCVIPVPLHPDKEKKRGFNQSRVIGNGIGDMLGIPCRDDLLVRKEVTSSQTKKTRFHRWENVSGVFECPDTQPLENLKVLLTDDVVTTGATLEACALKLMEAKGIRVWVATLGITT